MRAGVRLRSCPAKLAVVLVLLLFPFAAQARPGLYVGAGLVRQTASGDFDGRRDYTDATSLGPTVSPGRLEPGAGGLLAVGFGVNTVLAFEALMAITSHNAGHVNVADRQQATLSSLVLAGRLTAPVSGGVELFARLGVGMYALRYDRATQFARGLQAREATFSGTGYAGGAGVAVLFGPLGLELSATRHIVGFDEVHAGSQAHEVSGADMRLTSLELLLAYHF